MSHTETLEQAHNLIDHIAPRQVSAVVALLESMIDPVSRAIANAPYDDEPETEAERLAVAASKRSLLEHPQPALTPDQFLAEFADIMGDAQASR